MNLKPQEWYCVRDCDNTEMIYVLGQGLTVYNYIAGETYIYYPNNKNKHKTIYQNHSYRGCITEEFLNLNFIKNSDGEILLEVDTLFDELFCK